MFTKLFLKDMAERAIATFAQVVIAVFTVAAFSDMPTTQAELNSFVVIVPLALALGLIAAFLSVLKAIVAKYRGNKDSASLVKDV